MSQRIASAVSEIFKESPDRPSVEVLRRLRERGYAGDKSALYAIIAQLRPEKPQAPVVRFEGVCAEFSQCDFGHVRVKYDNGQIEN